MPSTIKTASTVDVFTPTPANHQKIQAVIDKVSPRGANPHLIDFLNSLQDFVSGAPAPWLVVAYNTEKKMAGALTFLDSRDEQEIRSVGVVQGENTARSLIRALDHRKTLRVSANTPEQELYLSLGFIHSEELDEEGGPSEMVKLPPGKVAASHRKYQSPLLQHAWEWAKAHHEGVDQKRKYTEEPYINHPEALVAMLQDAGYSTDDEMLAAALLHDTVEDTKATLDDVRREFGVRIEKLVEQLTDVAKPEDGKRDVRTRINREHSALGSPKAQSIKVVDIMHNLRDIATNDPGWAPKYLAEKIEVLKVLTKADPHLLKQAWELVDKLKEELRHPKQASVVKEFRLSAHMATVAQDIQAEVIQEGPEVTVRVGDATLEGKILQDYLTYYLTDIWVPPAERNKGIGQALMNKLVEFLHSKGVHYVLGKEANEEKIPSKIRAQIPGAQTVHLDFKEGNEPDAKQVFDHVPTPLADFLEDYTVDPTGAVLLTKIAKIISDMKWKEGAPVKKIGRVMASEILATEPEEQAKVEVPSSRVGETLWRALAYNEAVRRLQSIENGSKLHSLNEVANLEAKVAELSRHPINKPEMEALRNELIVTAKKCLTEGQMKRVRHGRWAEWSRAGKKLLPLLPDDLRAALLSWGSTHSASVECSPDDEIAYHEFFASHPDYDPWTQAWHKKQVEEAQARKKTSANISDLYCPNPDCADFEKRGHGNLTQEFAYGVDSDRHMIYCSTCKKRFSETKCTEFFGAKLNSSDISHILEKTLEGKSIREIADELDLNKDSVNNVLLKAKDILKEYVENGQAHITKDALGDMNLPAGQKGKLQDFINEILIPKLEGDEESGKDEAKKED